MVVFGWFCLEARCNTLLKVILNRESRKTNKALWEILKKANTLEKMRVICTYASASQQEEFNLLFPKLRDIFELRNRLAHFKDEHQPLKIDHPETLDTGIKIFEYLETVPDPPLMQELKGTKLDGHGSVIAQSQKWLSVISDEIVKKESGTLPNKSLQPTRYARPHAP